MFYRLVAKVAIFAAPLLVLTELGAGVDQVTNSRISNLLPWFPFLSPFILGAVIVAQLYMCSVMARRSFDAKRYRDMVVWLLLAVPAFVVSVIANMVMSYEAELHLSPMAALAQVGLTRTAVAGMAILMGVHASYVSDRLRRTLKEKKVQAE